MFKHLQRWERLALPGVLALAALLRFGWPGVNSFAFDEARLSLISLRMARAGEFAGLGMPSSARVPNLPAAAWIYALPYAVSPDPLAATLFTGALSLLAVALVWWLARRAWGSLPALPVALFLAASPYAVLYSRSIWAQDLLPALAALWLWSAWRAIRDRRAWALALHVFLAGFAFQVHFAGIALALGTAYCFLRFRWWRRFKPVLIGAALAVAAALPFALELARNPELLGQFGAAVGGESVIDFEAVTALARLGIAYDWRFLALGDLALGDSTVVLALAGLLLAAGLMAIIRGKPGHVACAGARRALPLQPDSSIQTYKERGTLLPRLPLREQGPGDGGRLLAELTLALLVAAPLFFLRHSTPVFVHYQLVALPALALLAGAAVCLLSSRAWRALVVITVTGLAGWWSVQLGDSLTLAGRVETPNGLGTPLGLLRDAAYSLPDDAPALLFTHGDDPNVDGEAASFDVLWWERPHRIVRGGELLILPDHPAYLMATLAPFQAWEELEASGLARDVLTFPRRDGALPFVATRYDGQTPPDGFTAVAPVALADGAILEGWRARRVGPRLRVSTLWRVETAPSDATTLQQFHHLRPADDAGAEPLISDVPLSAHRWQAGDRLVVMADFLDAPPGEYAVSIGHYTLPDLTRIPRDDGAGDSITLGPFAVE